ncbi:MAG: hypothetical protein HY782_20010 [Chloroflexi bacterium]|nr:hypothetical protein [Chloroflexota bacterium]
MANTSGENPQPIVATIGDATFLESGVKGLAHAVLAGSRFVLVILDSAATQDHARRKIRALVRGCGISFLREINPCNQDTFRAALKQAAEFAQAEWGGIAVIVATRPCAALPEMTSDAHPIPIQPITEPHACDECYDGFVVESNPMSIFELAQKVAREKQAVPRRNGKSA